MSIQDAQGVEENQVEELLRQVLLKVCIYLHSSSMAPNSIYSDISLRFSISMFLAFLLCFAGGGMFAVCLKLAADKMMQMQQEVQ